MEVCFSLAITGVAVLAAMALVGAGVKSHAMAKQRCLAAALATYVVTTYGDDFRLPMAPAARDALSLVNRLAVASPALVTDPGTTLDLPGKATSGASPLYRFPTVGGVEPFGPLVFQVSGTVTNGLVGTQYRVLRVWSCATNASLPAGVTFRGTLLGQFLYRDYADVL